MKLNRTEIIATYIVLISLALLLFWWALQSSGNARYDELPCEPDYIGGCW